MGDELYHFGVLLVEFVDRGFEGGLALFVAVFLEHHPVVLFEVLVLFEGAVGACCGFA